MEKVKEVEIICTNCSAKFTVQQASINRYIRKHGKYHYMCRKCMYATKLISVNSELWTEDRRNAHSIKMKDVCNKSEYKKANSDRIKKLWQSQAYRENIAKAHKRDKKVKSERSKKLWEDDDFRRKVTKNVNKVRYTDEFREKQSEASKKMWQDPEFRDRITKASSKNWKDKTYREKIAHSIQPVISKIHKTTMELLDDMGIEYESEYVIGPWSFDIFINTNGKKLLIEINGDWIHSQPNKKLADKQKATYINKYHSDYELKYIWEHEFYIDGMVKSLLSYWCDFDYGNEDFNLNDVSINEIDHNTASIFVGKYHYFGSIGRHGQYFGAYLEDKIIASAIFSNCGRKEIATSIGLNYSDIYELTRFCIHPSYHKRNFASWLLTRMAKRICKPWLVAFADSTHNHNGTIYKAAGWKMVDTIPPDYWYAKNDGWIMHKKTLWNRASNLKMTEKQFAEEYGFTKVWGYQKFKFLFDNRKNQK